jgi:hypothetical protein
MTWNPIGRALSEEELAVKNAKISPNLNVQIAYEDEGCQILVTRKGEYPFLIDKTQQFEPQPPSEENITS